MKRPKSVLLKSSTEILLFELLSSWDSELHHLMGTETKEARAHTPHSEVKETRGSISFDQSTWTEKKQTSFGVYILQKSCMELKKLKLTDAFCLQLIG